MVCGVLVITRLAARRGSGSIFGLSSKLSSLKHTIVPEQLRTKFSRASVSAAKQCTGAARDVEMIAMADVKRMPNDIKNVLLTPSCSITAITDYAFSGKGKMLRPLLVLLMAACANGHNGYSTINSGNSTPAFKFFDRHLKNIVTDAQHAIAVIAEMIHTASLMHDDLIDKAEMRRKQLATYRKFGTKVAVLVGNITLLKASELLAKVGNAEVVSVLSIVLDDLIRGEFMQLTSNADENYRFHLYLEKTYKKTASLIANSCKAVRFVSCPRGVGHMPYPLHNNYSLQVTILSEADGALAESAYAFGRHLGMAFQLLDDVLDFVGQEDKLGKPAGGSDLQLGLATGPVLFAAQQFPELERMLQHGLRTPEDQKKALELVHESNGIGQTRMLAEFHFQEAQRQLGHFKASDARECLLRVAATTLLRSF